VRSRADCPTNKGGDKRLRKLELRLLEAGVTVARTADDLIRYHGKYMIIDNAQLWLLGFNSTHLDIFRSRSFGVVTTDRSQARGVVRGGLRPPAVQVKRTSSSPENARARLATLIKAARTQLLIYDPRSATARSCGCCSTGQKTVDVRDRQSDHSRQGSAGGEAVKTRLHVRAIDVTAPKRSSAAERLCARARPPARTRTDRSQQEDRASLRRCSKPTGSAKPRTTAGDKGKDKDKDDRRPGLQARIRQT
jgi:hypothetical protein